MWELRSFVADVGFYFDEKRLQNNPKTSHPLSFSAYILLTFNAPKNKVTQLYVKYPNLKY